MYFIIIISVYITCKNDFRNHSNKQNSIEHFIKCLLLHSLKASNVYNFG